jgi:NAD-dependent SIR2 family protein deacetylase
MEILLNYSKYITILTGAGISTSSGIPDFRGKGTSSKIRPDLSKYFPSPVHNMISDLVNRGIIKHVITQNIDDLHLKSGVPEDKLIELHGNMMKEQCDICRTFIRHEKEIIIKRRCLCGGTFSCTIVNLNTNLDPIEFKKAEEETMKTDLLIVFGTSAKVSPANTLPQILSKKGDNIIVINNEPTQLDNMARIVYHDDIQTVLTDIYNYLIKGADMVVKPTIIRGFPTNIKCPKPWNCKNCTYYNTMRINDCEICEIQRISFD